MRIQRTLRCRITAWIVLCCSVASLSLAADSEQMIRSPMNSLVLMSDEDSGGYSFLATGHLYGAPSNRDSVMPASTLLANLDLINQSGAKFFVALGDNYRRADPLQIANFKTFFADRLKMPLFNAVGNHDVTDRAVYEKTFGKTSYHFYYRTELFVFLDTEIDAARISGSQLKYLAQLVDEATARKDIKSVFIFSHKLLWAVDPAYQVVSDHLNPGRGYSTAEPFSSTLAPLVERLAKQFNVYWISGDVGCNSSLSLFYERDEATGATFIATGIGEKPSDVMLQFQIPSESDKPVEITPISLAGGTFDNIETYDREYWQGHRIKMSAKQELF